MSWMSWLDNISKIPMPPPEWDFRIVAMVTHPNGKVYFATTKSVYVHDPSDGTMTFTKMTIVAEPLKSPVERILEQ
jgi:hypothetical protein